MSVAKKKSQAGVKKSQQWCCARRAKSEASENNDKLHTRFLLPHGGMFFRYLQSGLMSEAYFDDPP